MAESGIETIPTYQLLWAKTSKDKTQTHPLICHLIDVAQVTQALWKEVLTDGVRTQLSTALGLDVDRTGRLIAFWAGLHDLGKASPCFQRQHRPAVTTLTTRGLCFPRRFSEEPCYHGAISAASMAGLLDTEVGLPGSLAERVARATGGHHGLWPQTLELQALRTGQLGDSDWEALRRDLVTALVTLLTPHWIERLGATTQEENATLTMLSGLTSTADWIGSMESYFPYVAVPIELEDYARRAADQARLALQELGWTGWKPPSEPASFEELFGFVPRPTQAAIIGLTDQLQEPSLVLIEAPTGTGKTEAALYLADHWARACQQRGLYVAMPTMATSNQMFSRVKEALGRRYPASLVNLHLIHSQARWRDDVLALRLETTDEHQGGTVASMAWFLPRKRSLLAPFGVGTVDQALLSVLQTRHFFVRLFGLSHKTVIFDEVHAYDTYMSAIFQRLLDWLRAIGASVVVLSATLPAQTRRELLAAYAGEQELPLPKVSYPSITWATAEGIDTQPIEAPDSRTVALAWIGREPEAIAGWLAGELRDGGCAAIICNTVRRAQDLYRTLKGAAIVPAEDLILFHARFPLVWRDEIEQKVLSRFGKEGTRPRRAIVVATQVIEQSLDLDFDVMISDLAPVDLILQRAGRLHRHERENRPAPLTLPRLALALPADRDGVPDFGPDVYVYERYVLLRSYLALWGPPRLEQFILPAETGTLIEAVYGGEEPAPTRLTPGLAAALTDARQQMQRHEEGDVFKARQKLVPGSRAGDLLTRVKEGLEEDDPLLHEAFQALTRRSPPSVSLVCLHRTAAGLVLEPDDTEPTVNLDEEPGPDLSRELARHTLGVTHRRVVPTLLTRQVPPGWREHPLLRNHRAAIFEHGCCPLPDTPFSLRLSREFGLEIDEEVP